MASARVPSIPRPKSGPRVTEEPGGSHFIGDAIRQIKWLALSAETAAWDVWLTKGGMNDMSIPISWPSLTFGPEQ
jgi:hypothetical protein